MNTLKSLLERVEKVKSEVDDIEYQLDRRYPHIGTVELHRAYTSLAEMRRKLAEAIHLESAKTKG